ncbi:MAG: CRISPR-associated endonuclease Cas3'' [Treponema sp.]|jgi:CRISPR-associated endonuclease Cas3-HD|nr:CRISPR-associated endonuclease Cas3'' [Treponema sp.]
MYYAHSPRKKGDIPAQPYEKHISEVIRRARNAAAEAGKYAASLQTFLQTVDLAAEFHDIGKLDPKNQEVLSGKKSAKSLPVQHTDAGAAHLLNAASYPAAIAIQAHHIGYPDFITEQEKAEDMFRDTEIIEAASQTVRERVDKTLPELLSIHHSIIEKPDTIAQIAALDGNQQVALRMVLSCLADADHTDTAVNYGDYPVSETIIPLRAADRLKKLDKHVATLGKRQDERSSLRREMYQVCRDAEIVESISSCDSPVGSGKTTAVMAHLLRQADKRNLRRIIVVLPVTNIIKQSVDTYRKVLCFDDEDPEAVVAELHHRADFKDIEIRHLTALWRAPIIVTTAVAFFETLASNSTATLRRLHELPGSAIFVDEAHAALPVNLLPLAWRWINTYADEWSCYWVFASGSLCRFWELTEINGGNIKKKIPQIVTDNLWTRLAKYESGRITYKYDANTKAVEEIGEWVSTFAGPRLAIFNTVQNAAVVANFLEKHYGRPCVEHLSTALTAEDRDKTVERVKARLNDPHDTEWTLVATSCVEAGLDFSFHNGFRELGSLLSLLQAAGRVNREGEYSDAEIWSFRVAETGQLRAHPLLKDAAAVLARYFEKNTSIDPELSTQSIHEELILGGRETTDDKKLVRKEEISRFPLVEKEFKVINTDTRLTIVDNALIKRIENYEKVKWQEVQKKSVMIWGYKLENLRIPKISRDMYKWNCLYNDFLGYMAGVISVDEFTTGRVTTV